MGDADERDGAAWAWERIQRMAERWINTPEWHEPAFHDGRIYVTTAELHAAAILCYRRSIGLEGALTSPVDLGGPIPGDSGAARATSALRAAEPTPCTSAYGGPHPGTAEEHTCPYQSDVNDNDEFKCHCCRNCEQECAYDI